MVSDTDLVELMRTIGDGATDAAVQSVATRPELSTARLGDGATKPTSAEFFLESRRLQVYAGDTALHVAAAAYDVVVARSLVAEGADVRARNRRGAEPLHAATIGAPGSSVWDPRQQAAMVRYLVEVGADPEAVATGGVTPLHRAVRNRCSAAVRALLEAGADPRRPNDNGSSAITLAQLTTGRGGTGTSAAKAEQAEIIRMLEEFADEQA